MGEAEVICELCAVSTAYYLVDYHKRKVCPRCWYAQQNPAPT